MGCKLIREEGRMTAIICGASQRCRQCRNNLASKLCDYPTRPNKTCDFPMCAQCATEIAHGCDSCRLRSTAFDAAIFTTAMVRREMKAVGWIRKFLGLRVQRDLCPNCAKKAGSK